MKHLNSILFATLAWVALGVAGASAKAASAGVERNADVQHLALLQLDDVADDVAGDAAGAAERADDATGDGATPEAPDDSGEEADAEQNETNAASDEQDDEEGGDAEGADAGGDEMGSAGADGAEDVDSADDAAPRDWGRLQPAADLVEAGGPIIIILAVLSVISLAIIVVKLVQFTALRAGDNGFIERAARMIEAGDADGALDFVESRRGVVARVMEAALRGKNIGAPEAQVREEVERVARIKLDGLERGLPLLSLIATISPLLGLLGTVLGMIEAFQQLQNAGDRVDPAILSGGIWEALLTTAAGLSVAIPTASFFTWLQRTVDVAGQHMENAATRVFTADLYTAPKVVEADED